MAVVRALQRNPASGRQRRRTVQDQGRRGRQPAPRSTQLGSRDAYGVRQWLALPDKTPILRRARHRCRQLPARRPGLARADRAAVIRKDRNPQRDGAARQGGAGGHDDRAGLLSGTPKKSHAKGAQGGLLRQIGDFGIIVLKDFGSILSMHTETRAEVLAALREIYDGAWTRHLGTDGGRTLAWKGKVGLLFAATGVIDSHYAVIGSMGDRFLLSRLAPVGRGQFNRAMKHVGDGTKQMRKELAEAVARLFAGRKPEARAISRRGDQAHRRHHHAGRAPARGRRP